MSSSRFEQLLPQLMPLLAQQPASPELVQLVRPLADEGDQDATVLVAWALGQQGQWQDGLPYAERAIRNGAPFLAPQYVGTMVGQPGAQRQALDLLEIALEQGSQIDPLGWLPNYAQQNDASSIARLVSLAGAFPTPPRPERWDELVAELNGAQTRFADVIGRVDNASREAVDSIEAHEAASAQVRARLEALGGKVESLAHEQAANELTRQYAAQADSASRVAAWFTAGAIFVGGVAALLAAYFTVEQAQQSAPDPLEGMARAAIAIPLALLAAYIGRLAGSYRRTAVRWRHMVLQLGTAESYIAELADSRRQALIESLALRFFPGQSTDPLSDSGSPTDQAANGPSVIVNGQPAGSESTSQQP